MEQRARIRLLNYKGVSAMMKKRGKITLPNVSELKEIEEYLGDNLPTLSDSAVHVHSKFDTVFCTKDKSYSGEIWTRELSNDKITTYDFLNKKIDAKKAETTNIYLMPRFRNPEALAVGITEWQDEVVLTIDGKIVTLPNHHVDDNHPVRAMRCLDGSVQILDQIGPRRFEAGYKFHEGLPAFNSIQELNIDAFEISKYLYGLFDNMKRSTEFTNHKTNDKLTQPVDFNKSGLKADLHKTAGDIEIGK